MQEPHARGSRRPTTRPFFAYAASPIWRVSRITIRVNCFSPISSQCPGIKYWEETNILRNRVILLWRDPKTLRCGDCKAWPLACRLRRRNLLSQKLVNNRDNHCTKQTICPSGNSTGHLAASERSSGSEHSHGPRPPGVFARPDFPGNSLPGASVIKWPHAVHQLP